MDPGLFFGGVLAGLLIAQAWVSGTDASAHPSALPPGSPHPAAAAKVAEARAVFLPHTAENIQLIKATEPEAAASWKAMAARIPYLTEAVAMYYAMEDPNTPTAPKLSIAGSLLYLVSPADVIPDAIPFIGQVDDIGVLLAALKYVYDYIGPEHIEKARAWLISQGVEPKPFFAIGKDLDEMPEKVIQATTQGQTPLSFPFPTPSTPTQPQLPAAPQGATPQLPGPTTSPPQTSFGRIHDDQPPAPPPTWNGY